MLFSKELKEGGQRLKTTEEELKKKALLVSDLKL